MYRNQNYPEWAKAEKMEMSTPLCELWGYAENVEKTSRRKGGPYCEVSASKKPAFASVWVGVLRRKTAKMLYRLADCIYADDSERKKRMEYV